MRRPGRPIPEKLAYFSALGMTTEQAFKKTRAFVNKYQAKAVIIDPWVSQWRAT